MDRLDREELRVSINVLPIRINLDQDTAEFLVDFFSKQATSSTEAPEEPETPEEGSGSANESFIQSFRFEETKICLDYRPKRIDFKGCAVSIAHSTPLTCLQKETAFIYAHTPLHSHLRLQEGDYIQLIHLFPLEGVVIDLLPVDLKGMQVV